MLVVAAAAQAAAYLVSQGFRTPAWDTSLGNVALPPATAVEDGDGVDYLRGWQRRASRACNERALETHFTDLSPASRALLLSQAGPHSGRVFTVLPTSDDVTIASAQFRVAQFRVLLLRRLRLPLALCPRTCRCGRRLDPLGDHRAACATSGVSPTRAQLLEHALARVCREAGARVARNVRVADMNIDVPVSDARRIEVVCNGLPFWHGTQLAVDATLVSPLTREGQPQPAADAQPGVALARAAQRKRRHTYPELLRARRCRLVVSGIETGGRWSEEAVTFLRLLAQARVASAPVAVRRAAQAHGCTVGVASSPLPRSEPSRLRCSSFLQPQSSVLLVTRPLCTSSWLTHAGCRHPPTAASQPAPLNP